jgi:hypothetical protein
LNKWKRVDIWALFIQLHMLYIMATTHFISGGRGGGLRQHSYLLCVWTLQRSDIWQRLLYGMYFRLTDCFFQHQVRYIPAVFIAIKRLQNWHLVGTKSGTRTFIVSLYLYYCWRSSYRDGEGWYLINRFNHAMFLYLSQASTWISNPICCDTTVSLSQ